MFLVSLKKFRLAPFCPLLAICLILANQPAYHQLNGVLSGNYSEETMVSKPAVCASMSDQFLLMNKVLERHSTGMASNYSPSIKIYIYVTELKANALSAGQILE